MRTSVLYGLCTVALLSLALPARAIVIEVSTDGTNYTTLAGTAGIHVAQFDSALPSGVQINWNTESNSPGLPNESNLTSSPITVTNPNSGAATIYFKFSDTDFTSPVNPGSVDVAENISGSILVAGAGDAMSFQSFADPANGEATTSGIALPALTPDLMGLPPSAFSDSASDTITSGLTAGYSLTQAFKLTLDGGSSVSLSANTTLAPAASTAVPLPATGLSALVLVGIVVGVRQVRGLRAA